MTTFENRPGTALLVVDVQNGAVAGAHERDAVVANVGTLVERARREHVPVVWVQHVSERLGEGSDEGRNVPQLAPARGGPRVGKASGGPLSDTKRATVVSRPRGGGASRVGAGARAGLPPPPP